ncbi:hypothetical protein HKCCE4037_18050 [Rhodobacterales bacterium HKCCE4037]|nr:hypothetical protein [Rhodobacterales bacterium HKCCE4037]
MRVIVLFLLTFLAACAPQQGQLVAPDLGISGQFTRQVVISDDAHHVLTGHLVQTTQNGVRTRALVIGQRFDGVHRLRMTQAWMNGTTLPFSGTTRRLDGCTHGHCRDNAVGMILLSDQLFSHARAHGLAARLTGPSDNIDIRVPASLFPTLPE